MSAHDTNTKPIWRPSELRKAVTEWVSQGFSVKVAADGSVQVNPPSGSNDQDAFDLVDFKQ
ncbi:hypothetical protein [Tritonibacter scottomollicae]|uniref:hypothetical protein n=1 Tax=Tritonibacter scottomollicae TaxID=483013 RepID=UPI003AA92432